MTALDRYHTNLRCPSCDHTGVIHFWEHDGRSFDGVTHVDRVEGDFDVIYFNTPTKIALGRLGGYRIYPAGAYRGVVCRRCKTTVHDVASR